MQTTFEFVVLEKDGAVARVLLRRPPLNVLRAPTLRPGEKLTLLGLLSGQVASMVYSYELPQGFRSALQRLRDAVRLRRRPA